MPLKLARRKGQRNWYVEGAVGGVRVRESAKTPDRRVAEAFRIARERELEDRRVLGPAAVATFAEAINLYLDAAGPARASAAGRFLAPLLEHLGKARLASLTQADLDAAARAIHPGAKASTLNRQVYTPFIAVMNEAAIAGLAPYRKWRRPKGHARPTRFRWLWPAELERVWAAAPPHGRVLLDLLAGSGLREAEAAALDWRDVSLATGELWVWESKTDAPRRVEIPPRTVAALAMLDHRDGEVILNGGGAPYVLAPNGGGAFSTGLARWAHDANVEPFAAHVLRHTFATWYYSATRDRERLKAQGGWRSDQVDRYCHLAPRSLEHELAAYGWRFDRPAENAARARGGAIRL